MVLSYVEGLTLVVAESFNEFASEGKLVLRHCNPS